MLVKNSSNKLIVFFSITLLIFLSRILINIYLDLPLHFDEAQYWGWSQNLDWGYFSKPPLLALLIRIITEICGNGESCIKSLSSFLHTTTSIILFYSTFLLTQNIKKSIFCAFIYLLMPGITFSSLYISTDVPLLFFSSLVALFIIKIYKTSEPHFINFFLLGIIIGLGILSKYAFLYLILSFSLCMICDKDCKKFLFRRNFLISLLIATLIVIPNIIWNIENQFVTFSHTASNANLKGLEINLIQGAFFNK